MGGFQIHMRIIFQVAYFISFSGPFIVRCINYSTYSIVDSAGIIEFERDYGRPAQ